MTTKASTATAPNRPMSKRSLSKATIEAIVKALPGRMDRNVHRVHCNGKKSWQASWEQHGVWLSVHDDAIDDEGNTIDVMSIYTRCSNGAPDVDLCAFNAGSTRKAAAAVGRFVHRDECWRERIKKRE